MEKEDMVVVEVTEEDTEDRTEWRWKIRCGNPWQEKSKDEEEVCALVSISTYDMYALPIWMHGSQSVIPLLWYMGTLFCKAVLFPIVCCFTVAPPTSCCRCRAFSCWMRRSSSNFCWKHKTFQFNSLFLNIIINREDFRGGHVWSSNLLSNGATRSNFTQLGSCYWTVSYLHMWIVDTFQSQFLCAWQGFENSCSIPPDLQWSDVVMWLPSWQSCDNISSSLIGRIEHEFTKACQKHWNWLWKDLQL